MASTAPADAAPSGSLSGALESPVSIADIQSLPQRQPKKRRGQAETKTMEEVTREAQYEYLDHTADIQLHSWGKTLAEAFEQVALCMYNYMSELQHVSIDPECDFEIRASGHDLDSLLYAFLDECLYQFATEDLICKDLRIQSMDLTKFALVARGRGEKFDLAKHPQGTEIKAITYSNMQIFQDFKPREHEKGSPGCDFPVHVYVIVDI